MLWIILAVAVFFIIKFFLSLSQDNDDLQNGTLSEKFETIVSMLNQAAFSGAGNVTVIDKREFNLYEEGQNQIIKFHYSTGILTITWKYKYFQKEVVHKKDIPNARNFSIFEQAQIAERIIKEMQTIVLQHQIGVLGNI